MKPRIATSPIYNQPGLLGVGTAARGLGKGQGETQRQEVREPQLRTCEEQVHRNPVGYLETIMARRHGHNNVHRIAYGEPEKYPDGGDPTWKVTIVITLPGGQTETAFAYGNSQKKAKRGAARNLIRKLGW
jgi:hypothetical protein